MIFSYKKGSSVVCVEIRDEVIKLLGSAQTTVVVAGSLLADAQIEDTITRLVKRNVRIYLLAGKMSKDKNNQNPYSEEMRLEPLQNLVRGSAGNVMIRFSPNSNANLVLVDAVGKKKENAEGLLLTASQCSFENSGEIAIRLTEFEVEQLSGVIGWALFEYATRQIDGSGTYTATKPLKLFPHPLDRADVLTTTTKSNSLLKNSLKIVNNATTKLIVANNKWEQDHNLTNAICRKAENGVEVFVLTTLNDVSINALEKMRASGAKICGIQSLNVQAIWNDINEAMVMSANLQTQGLNTGFEVGVNFNNNRHKELYTIFQKLLEGEHSESLPVASSQALTGTDSDRNYRSSSMKH